MTLIIYLVCQWPEQAQPGPGLNLEVFAENSDDDSTPTAILPTRTNSFVIGRGSRFPHRRPKLQQGERLYALTACFQPLVPNDTAVDEVDDGLTAHDTQSIDLTSEETSELDALIANGFSQWQAGEFDAALELFAQVLAQDEQCDRAWSGSGHCYWSLGQFDQALDAFTEATQVDAYNPSHWSNIGLCLRDLGEFDRAINAFKVAVQLDPEYAPAINEWGNVLQDQQQYHEALQFYYRALALDPSRAVVHHNLGVVYNRLGQTDLAFDAFKKALDLDPEYTHSLEEIAILYMENDMLDEAEQILDEVATDRAAALKQELQQLSGQ